MFRERYQQALAFKSLDVEENIDRYFHRPVAAAIAALLLPTRVTPNQVTLSSLVAGWSGSFVLFQAFFLEESPFYLWPLAGALLFLAVILDCVDGQLARAKGGGSRVGRILDGFVDVLVLVPAYVILGFGIKAHFGTTWIWIAALAGFSTWIHCIVYDKVKNLYLAQTMPSAGGGEGTETLADVRADQAEARENGSPLERFLLWVYVGYLQVQEKLASGSTDKVADKLSPLRIARFREKHCKTMRLASYLGLGTHMWIIYTGIALAAFDLRALLAMQVLFATVFNVVLFLVLLRPMKSESKEPAASR